ncbi:hypothetical protein ONS95_010299 [Cadophora gregata]|uniref:uncharacterized protein n=1 Tax=Cadophora gregata TaxID=51156 RepID=UPI0026DD18C4|nr:uncharacterized protein ONS95_010299 [Cadophora gregata]KAK0122034.1 hypothetical protein ONS95_010299 [Cadophora gregata]
MDKSQSETYLTSLLNKTLRITTTDTRMFLGQFKCTDSDLNIILAQTYEYRLPAPPKPKPSPSTTNSSIPIVQDMTSRYVGLVVVPGDYITRIEVEEFESQMKGLGKGAGSGKMVGEGLRDSPREGSREKEGREAFCVGRVCEPDTGSVWKEENDVV